MKCEECFRKLLETKSKFFLSLVDIDPIFLELKVQMVRCLHLVCLYIFYDYVSWFLKGVNE
jgi:hypothetical protein